MKIALQLGLIPGRSVADKVKWARDAGVQGIELSAFSADVDGLYKLADQVKPILPVCSVCGNATLDGRRGFDFLDPDPGKRRDSIEGSKAILGFCGQVGAAGQIVPPIFGGPVVPDLSPVLGVPELEDRLMVAALKQLGPWAAGHKTLFLLEPLNRYEQHYLRRQADGVRVIEKAKVRGVKLLSDFFHMHIEETDTPAAIRAAGRHVGHVHLADNTRLEPGTGDIDFVAGFKALKQIGFKGFMAYECGVSGSTANEKQKNLAKSISFLQRCVSKAGR